MLLSSPHVPAGARRRLLRRYERGNHKMKKTRSAPPSQYSDCFLSRTVLKPQLPTQTEQLAEGAHNHIGACARLTARAAWAMLHRRFHDVIARTCGANQKL